MSLLGDQTGCPGTWKGISVRDSQGRKGVVVRDYNWDHRFLEIRFDDGDLYTLVLNNCGKDPLDPLGIQWEWNPGRWGFISET